MWLLKVRPFAKREVDPYPLLAFQRIDKWVFSRINDNALKLPFQKQKLKYNIMDCCFNCLGIFFFFKLNFVVVLNILSRASYNVDTWIDLNFWNN